jgi:hypothetical protein
MRYYHCPVDPEKYAEQHSFGDEDRKAALREEAKKHFKQGQPHHENFDVIDDKVMLKKPRMFWQWQDVPRLNPQTRQTEFVSVPVPDSVYVEWTKGSVVLSLPEPSAPRGGDRFWVIPPGGCIDISDDVPVKTVKDACPHLVTEAEARMMGMLDAPKPKTK